MPHTRLPSLRPPGAPSRARFESAALGRFEVLFSHGCERFIGRFALLPELRSGDGIIRFAALAEDLASRNPPLT